MSNQQTAAAIREEGEALFQAIASQIASNTPAWHFVSIHLDSGDFEVSDDMSESCLVLRSRRPEGSVWTRAISDVYAPRINAGVRLVNAEEKVT